MNPFSSRLLVPAVRAALTLLALVVVAPLSFGQQKPKRNAEVLVTFDVAAPDIAYQSAFPNNNNGTLNFYVWDTLSTESKFNATWNGTSGAPAGTVTHSGPQHMLLRPNRDYSATIARLNSTNTWGELKISAPPGYAVMFNGIARESFRAVASELTNNIFSFSIREIGDGAAAPSGYSASPDLAPFVWTISSGTYANGLSLTPIQLRAPNLSAALLSPTALNFVNPFSPEVGVTMHSDGGLLELDTFQAILHFRRGSPAGGYTVEVYSPYAQRTGSGDGPFTYSEAPYREFRVSNPDGGSWNNRLQIEKIEREAGTVVRTETWLAAQNGTSWTITESTSLRVITRTSSVNGANREETIEVKDNSNVLASRVKRVYQTFPWGQEELVQEISNPGATNGTELTTSYAYHTASGTGGYGRLKSVISPDGSWVRYNYEDSAAGVGNLKEVLKPWQGSPGSPDTATSTNSHATSLSYAPERAIFADLPAGSETRINNTPAAKTVVATTFPGNAPNGQPLRQDVNDLYTGSGSFLRTIVQAYNPTTAAPDFRGRPYSRVNPDGTQTSFLRYKAYFWNYEDNNATVFKKWPGNPGADNTWGEYSFNGFNTQVEASLLVNNWDGQSFAPIYMVPNRSTVELVIYSAEGRPWFTTKYVFTGASGGTPTFEFLSQSEAGYDNGLPAVARSLNGFREQRAFYGDQLSGVVSNDGSYVEYSRDGLGRDVMARKFGIDASGDYPAQSVIYTHKTFDAANRVLTEKISTSPTPADPGIQTSRAFGLGGLLETETDASGITTSYTYAFGGRKITATSSAGTRIEDRHPLGTLVSGTTVVPQFSRVTVNGNGTLTTTSYTLTAAKATAVAAALTANSEASLATELATVPRWSKATTDWAGRTIEAERPGPAGATPASVKQEKFYNSSGQLVKTRETNLADALVKYNAWQEPFRTGMDLNANGELDLTSSDRITESDTVFEKDAGGAWWASTTSKVYNELNSANAVTVSVSKVRLNRYSDHGRLGTNYIQSESKLIDPLGNATVKTVSVQRGMSYFANDVRLVTEITDYPDSTTDAIAVSRNGLPQRSQSKEGLVYRTYYDGLARPIKTTDPRTDASGTPRIGYFDGTAPIGSRHKVQWREDSAGNRTTFAYSTTTGLVFSETNPLSKTVYYSYNARGQVRRTWGAAAQPVEYEFNDYGERTTMRTWRMAPAGIDFSTGAWDASTYPSVTGDATTWSYDAATGLLLSKTSAAADPASADPVRNTSQVVSYTYNTRGQLRTRDWARVYGTGKLTTTYAYLGEQAGEPKTGELSRVDYEDTTPDVSYTYTRLGNAKTISDASGVRTFDHRPWGQVKSEALSAGYFSGRTVAYEIDTLGRTSGYSLSTAPSTYELNISYGYDAAGRFNQLTNLSAGVAFTYTYTANSNLIGSIANSDYAWSQTRTYEASRDALDVIETKAGVTSKARFDYTVDALGRRSAVAKMGEMFARYGANGLDTSWAYNDRSEVTGETMKQGGTNNGLGARSLTFDYDLIGNRKTAVIDSRTLTYASNAANQYDTVAGRNFADVTGLAPVDSTVYVAGNAVPTANRRADYFAVALSPSTLPSWQNVGIGLSAASSDTSRKLFLPANPELLTYDADGNLTSDGQWNYAYDAENRLIRAETRPNLLAFAAPAGPVPTVESRRLEFAYDYLGRRIEKVVKSGFNGTTYATTTTTRFVYEGWNLLVEYNTTFSGSTATLAAIRRYTWGLDWSGTLQGAGGVGGLQFVSDNQAGDSYFTAYDGNGNVMALISTTGALRAMYEYDAFGQTLRAEGAAANVIPFRFSTKFTDNETGLVYYGLRYYSPSLGRFVNRDPIEEEGGLNLYGFVSNAAVNAWDYLGMSVGTQGRFDLLFEEQGNTGRTTGGGAEGSLAWAAGTGLGVATTEMDSLSNSINASPLNSGNWVQNMAARAAAHAESKDVVALQAAQSSANSGSSVTIRGANGENALVNPGDEIMISPDGRVSILRGVSVSTSEGITPINALTRIWDSQYQLGRVPRAIVEHLLALSNNDRAMIADIFTPASESGFVDTYGSGTDGSLIVERGFTTAKLVGVGGTSYPFSGISAGELFKWEGGFKDESGRPIRTGSMNLAVPQVGLGDTMLGFITYHSHPVVSIYGGFAPPTPSAELAMKHPLNTGGVVFDGNSRQVYFFTKGASGSVDEMTKVTFRQFRDRLVPKR
jgi:RHS repeat-associated protein